MQTRTYNSIRNSLAALLVQLISVLLSFITRTVFIKMLAVDYLGVNGLFSNILSILSLAEMGIGTAIVYAMYKPIAENDVKKISALLNLYAKSYKIIGIVISIAGLALVPFLNYLIKDKPNIPNIELIYVLFLANSVSSYFFAYKRSIVIASQNGHINSFNQILFLIIQNIFQVIVLIGFKQFMPYLIIQIICTFCSNVAISYKADRMFPYLKKYSKETVDSVTRKNILKNVLAMVSNKIGSVVVSGTSNLLISAFVGVYWVGLYSNYVLIISTLKNLIIQMMSGITASVGNLTATENEAKIYLIFRKVFFINFIISIYCSVFLLVLVNPFISLWIGEEYLLSNNLVIAIVVNFFIIQMRQPAIIFIDTYGLFWNIKWKSLVEAVINLVISLILLGVFKLGILGVMLGTITSNIFTNVWWEPHVVFKYRFNKKLRKYFSLYFCYAGIGILVAIISQFLSNIININGFLGLLTRGLLCLIVTSVTIVSLFHQTDEFIYFIKLIKDLSLGILIKLKGRNGNVRN